ncbi:hypothetical protein [Pseudomonas matsuisoli]|uniref:Uncharacterized protein n=1 Tax=Pseudomonas matsuisoli TaxID=1515666 RepID=A0A917V188_9PSED|nr:hypothetical protein [Pseudomonas matsuisoli]GGK07174.1 hypothetical protein GCM10009304_36740 [Pseudomonas matsuisoli]
MKEDVMRHWRAFSPEHRRLAVGAVVIVMLALVLVMRSLNAGAPGARGVDRDVTWNEIWSDLQRLRVAEPMTAEAWRRALPDLAITDAVYDDPLWSLTGSASELADVDAFRAWARERGWYVQQARIVARERVHFSLTLSAALVRNTP